MQTRRLFRHRACLRAVAWSLLLAVPAMAQSVQSAPNPTSSPAPTPSQPPPYSDSSPIPDTPAYERAREVLELVNKGDVSQYLRYVQESFAPPFRDASEHHGEVYNDFRSVAGTLTVHGARTYDPPRPETSAILVVRTGISEQWMAIILDVEDAPPYKIASLNFGRARTPSDLPKAEALSDSQIAQELGAYVERLAKQDAFSGAVLLAKDGEVLLSAAVGQANRDFKVPNTVDTKFNLGSMNKMFTAVAILQLAEQGKLSLDDTLAKHLDTSWLSQDILDRVTIRQLLNHTSGLGSYFNETFERTSRAHFREVNDYKPLTVGETLAFEPGTKQRYSNTGFLIAGAVVEKASGDNYFEYIRKHVTGPAGMSNTDCYQLDHVNDNLAVGYERLIGPGGSPTEYFNNIFAHVFRGGPAGGGYSTVTDLLRFDRALRAGRLLDKDSLAAAWTRTEVPQSFDYGLGFFVEDTAVGRAVGHGGDFAGISAQFRMYLESGYTVSVLSNYDGAARLVEAKARELIGQGR
ncbi:MAG: beta-lactamase family protein [Phycisphaeraceae bacterium]|nr:beta-lactamase family protein [Phycisphaeraceae bacterium]